MFVLGWRELDGMWEGRTAFLMENGGGVPWEGLRWGGIEVKSVVVGGRMGWGRSLWKEGRKGVWCLVG